MSLVSEIMSLNIKGIELCECMCYRTHSTCWHILPELKRKTEDVRHEEKGEKVSVTARKTPDKFIQNRPYHFQNHPSPRDKALRFQESLRSQGIQSELREEGNTFVVLFRKKGWKGNTYSYVKIFS